MTAQPEASLPEVSPVPAETTPVQAQADGQQGRWTAADPYVLTAAQLRRQISRANRYARYEQIVTLFSQGRERAGDRSAVAQQSAGGPSLCHGRNVSGARTHGPTSKQTRSYLPYLRQRWEQGCHNGLQLVRELRAQGFRGSASLVGKLLGDWRVRLPGPPERVRGKKRQAAPPVRCRLSARQASWLFVTDQQQLTADQRVLIEHICQTNAGLQELYQLGQDGCRRWSSNDKHSTWLPGLFTLTRVLRPSSEALPPASSGITPPSKQRYLFLGVRDKWKGRLRVSNC